MGLQMDFANGEIRRCHDLAQTHLLAQNLFLIDIFKKINAKSLFVFRKNGFFTHFFTPMLTIKEKTKVSPLVGHISAVFQPISIFQKKRERNFNSLKPVAIRNLVSLII